MNISGYISFTVFTLATTVMCGQSAVTAHRFNFAEPILESAIVDDRDGTLYRTIKIGDKVWFAENLRYDSPNSLCYKKKKKNCEELGRLYPISDLPMACPAGWRVPTLNDWEDLHDHLGPDKTYGLLDSEGWSTIKSHTNSLGLSLQGAGYQEEKNFVGLGNAVTLWLNGFNRYGDPYHVHIYGGTGVYFKNTDLQTNEVFHAHPIKDQINYRYSVRCVCEAKN